MHTSNTVVPHMLGMLACALLVVSGCGDGGGDGGDPDDPSVLTHPSSQVVTEGQTATFVVVATGSGTLSYQWRRDAADIPAATGSTYTFVTTMADDGVAFTCEVTDAVGSVESNAAILTVTEPPPTISLNPTSLASSCTEGMNAASQTFEVWNSGGGTLSYTITGTAGWLSCSPASGTSTGEHDTVTVTYTTSGLAVGIHTATITVTDVAATNSPQTVAVTLAVDLAHYRVVSLATGTVTHSQAISDLETNDAYKTTHLVLRLVPAGSFQMGNQVSSLYANELPVHTVNITQPFYMGVFEVTQQQWTTIEGSWTFNWPGNPKRPAEMISWNDIKQSGGFMDTLSSLASMSFRLPTEAAGEYCCTAGTSTNYSYGNTEDGAWMWYWDNSSDGTKDVGTTTSKPNPWGLYDMHGNVWEWCEDWFGSYPSGTANDPTGPGSGSYRVLRGGSWIDLADNCRSVRRNIVVPSGRHYNLGFRVAIIAAGP